MKLNNQLIGLLINNNKINKLDIFIGKTTLINNGNKLFSKTISKAEYDKLFNKFIKNKFINYKEQLYRYSNSYLSITNDNKNHYKKTYYKNFINDKYLFILYNQSDEPYVDFTCKKDYHIIINNITKFFINNEISILFIENKNKYIIKLEINVNHNIDLTLKIINSLID